VTLTFDLQIQIGAIEYSLSVLSQPFKPFMRHCGNKIWPDEQMKEQTDWQARDSLKTSWFCQYCRMAKDWQWC